ncbi:hypothetical protein HanRHA438_Chr10g0468811 [Helianthus annuus]|nr:hypothetical protein HanIR_Chr10g0491441 [Helianthus annuus]KAJ0880939.1 hypothetical protein HanRHA438_Chr10g0468811 [Helianthus annuus]
MMGATKSKVPWCKRGKLITHIALGLMYVFKYTLYLDSWNFMLNLRILASISKP